MADRLTRAQRSYNMSRIRGFDTSLEVVVRRTLRRLGLRFKANVMSLPGRPDVVFPSEKVIVFIDGDFWHGFRYPSWQRRLPAYWRAKIERNRARDLRNFAKLRRRGWRVVRVWEHEVKRDLTRCIARIITALRGVVGDARLDRRGVWKNRRRAQRRRWCDEANGRAAHAQARRPRLHRVR
jgi:DNA mismatch endonuclease (patch repair protein)